MQKKEYNGWHNYETWLTALWIGNDRGLHEYFEERAKEIQPVGALGAGRYTSCEYRLAREMEAYFEELNPLAEEASIWSDMLNTAFSEVNWDEIAAHYIEDYSSASS